ncbi:MAG: NifB/NifX family molybdenum-iron cluster-binding protein [Thermodesulfobacteriota bacterium]
MKTAIAAKGKDLTSQVDERFGRADFFLITDKDCQTIEEVIENVSKNDSTGAGTGAASLVAEKGVSFLVAGNLGPKAENVISTAGINFISFAGTVSEAMEFVRQNSSVQPDSFQPGAKTQAAPSADSFDYPRAGKGTGQGRGMGMGRGMGTGPGGGRGQCRNPGKGQGRGGGGGKGMGRQNSRRF